MSKTYVSQQIAGATVREMAGRDGSMNADGDTLTRNFLVKGSEDPQIAYAILVEFKTELQLQAIYGMTVSSISWKLISGSESWQFTATYDYTPDVGEFTITMDTTGGTTKQTEAFHQWIYPAQGETARQFKTTVNVQDNKPEGVDRIIPALKLNIRARIPSSKIGKPISYAKLVAGLTGTVNKNPYLTFAAGELLFLGASGTIVGENPVLDYGFAASPNLSNVTIGGITGINKRGHDFLWFDYKVLKDEQSGLQISKARAAYSAEVYTYSDFSALQIGQR